MLDLYYKDEKNKSEHISENIKDLNEIGIIYIDIKSDNIGYSHIDKRMRIQTNEWLVEPPFYYNYKEAYKLFLKEKYENIDIFNITKDGNNKLEQDKKLIDEVFLNDFFGQNI